VSYRRVKPANRRSDVVRFSMLPKAKGTKGPSLVVEAPDRRYESYWKPETMEIVETKSKSSLATPTDRHSPNNLEDSEKHFPRSIPTILAPIFKPHYPFVILDCANIGWAFGGSSFSAIGLKIAYDALHDLPINLYGFLPASYVRRKPKDGTRGNSLMVTEDWEILDQLIGSRQVRRLVSHSSVCLFLSSSLALYCSCWR
jgi:hypothetical protein